MKKTEIFFPIEPKPKGRPKFTSRGHAYTPKTTLEYESKIKNFYQEQTEDFYDSAIRVKLTFNMPIPKSTSNKKRNLMIAGIIKCTVHNGDVDNLAKAVLDALNGVAYEDDCLITKLTIIKKYSSDDNVGTELEICEEVE